MSEIIESTASIHKQKNVYFTAVLTCIRVKPYASDSRELEPELDFDP